MITFHNWNIVDGRWSGWRDWEICSVTCGGGIQNRERTCTNPPPAHGGKDCIGERIISRACNEDPCPGMNKTPLPPLLCIKYLVYLHLANNPKQIRALIGSKPRFYNSIETQH